MGEIGKPLREVEFEPVPETLPEPLKEPEVQPA